MYNFFINVFTVIGDLTIRLFKIDNYIPVAPENILPSAGRSYINFDGYDPDLLCRNNSLTYDPASEMPTLTAM